MKRKVNKEELIKLVKMIIDPRLPDELGSQYIDILKGNVPHPAPSDLIFWNDIELVPEEVVGIALNYKKRIPEINR